MFNRNATRNVNYRNMLGDEDDEEELVLNEQSPNYQSSEDDSKPPPVISRKKDKHNSRQKKRIISDSEYEEENSKSDSIADSGSTEKLETVKRKYKPDLNSDSEPEAHIQSKIMKIDKDDSKSVDNFFANAPINTIVETPMFPSLAMLNPMRAKGDEDDDIENEVESETECDLTISLSEDLNNQNLTPKV